MKNATGYHWNLAEIEIQIVLVDYAYPDVLSFVSLSKTILYSSLFYVRTFQWANGLFSHTASKSGFAQDKLFQNIASTFLLL